MTKTLSILALLAIGAPLVALTASEPAKEAPRSQKARDHDLARQAVLRHELLPLPRIMAIATSNQPGEIIEIELKSKLGSIHYDVHVLTNAGAVRELLIDARTGKLIVNRPKDD